MHASENRLSILEKTPDQAENSYFGNPYQLHHEQYGLEYLDRNTDAADEIERVVILGYN